jgi:hypothetical protein
VTSVGDGWAVPPPGVAAACADVHVARVDAAGAVVGTLASVAAQGRLALAVLARERAPGDLHTGTSALRARPLAEGLQRPV